MRINGNIIKTKGNKHKTKDTNTTIYSDLDSKIEFAIGSLIFLRLLLLLTVKENIVPKINIGLVHGKLNKKIKDSVIDSFRKGDIQLLICTTVIEVGVDVPEATLMIIENPERLGLSQLHQLRGRVGRKENSQSHCLLLHGENLSESAKERIKAMEETNDGFKIAEKDLELRGSGDIYGLRQSGMMNLKIANPVRDSELLEEAQVRAIEIAKNNKKLAYSLVDRWIGTKLDYSDS